MPTTPSVALLDADILLYIAARGAEDVIDWEDGTDPMVMADMDKAKSVLADAVNAWHQMSGCDTYKLVFSDRENPCFRNAVYPIYKKHREGYDRPSLYDPLTEWLKMREQGEWYLYPTMEADDVLGIKQTHCTMCNVHTVIVSIDKDMLTIPGYHLNPNKADDGVIHVDEDTADYNWMMQTLAGDRVDNYKGAPGIGPGGAAKLLDPWKGHLTAMWEAVLEGYHAQWGKPNWNAKFQFDDPYVEALANARCARILRYCDHNPETKEPILWTP